MATTTRKPWSFSGRVRSRANAPIENVSGTALKDAIYWERVRELVDIIDYAGLRSTLEDSTVTFFAPTDRSIRGSVNFPEPASVSQ